MSAVRDAIAKGLDAPRAHGLFSDTITNIEAALTAAGYAVEQGWQPIETAPRDGTPVYGATYPKRVVFIVRWDGFDWIEPSGGLRDPTHWRPLPAAPEANDDRR